MAEGGYNMPSHSDYDDQMQQQQGISGNDLVYLNMSIIF